MNLAAVSTAINDRLGNDDIANVGMLNLLGGRHYNTQAPPDSAYPYLVWDISGLNPTDAFAHDVVEVTVDFHVYSSTQAGLPTVTTILDRLYGDATTHGDRVPTYGLHRWTPSLPVASGSWTATAFRCIGQFSQSDTVDAYHYVVSYQTIISR